MKRRGNRGWSTKAKPTKARPFVVRFDGVDWRVRHGRGANYWHHAKELSLLAPAIGNGAGELVGVGVVTRQGTTIRITA
jgi:hypothetical protein